MPVAGAGPALAAPPSALCPTHTGLSFPLRVTDHSAAGAWAKCRGSPGDLPRHPRPILTPVSRPAHPYAYTLHHPGRPPGDGTRGLIAQHQLQPHPRARPSLLLAPDGPPGEPDAAEPSWDCLAQPSERSRGQALARSRTRDRWLALAGASATPSPSSCAEPRVHLPLPKAPHVALPAVGTKGVLFLRRVPGSARRPNLSAHLGRRCSLASDHLSVCSWLCPPRDPWVPTCTEQRDPLPDASTPFVPPEPPTRSPQPFLQSAPSSLTPWERSFWGCRGFAIGPALIHSVMPPLAVCLVILQTLLPVPQGGANTPASPPAQVGAWAQPQRLCGAPCFWMSHQTPVLCPQSLGQELGARPERPH